MSNIAVLGAGYVGLVTGACLAHLGYRVTCVETDLLKLRVLLHGDLPFREPGLDELVARESHAGRLTFTGDYAEAISQADFAVVAVNTPTDRHGRADTGFVFAGVRSALAQARPGLVIIIKSTVPIGTGDALAALAESQGPSGVEIVSNPEFLREGCAIRDFMEPDRVVIGAASLPAGATVARLYERLNAPVIFCSRRSAELAKYAANALLATRISFMNEVAAICEAAEVDIADVERVVGLDRRIGTAFLRAGLGWGGSCFPKDIRALATTASTLGCRPTILQAIQDVNAAQRARAFDQLHLAVRGRANATVGVLGLAFKPETDDIREAPALEVIGRLLAAGIRIRVHDPAAMANARRVFSDVQFCEDAYDVALGSDALLLATEWSDYLSLDWSVIRSRMRGRVILDGRNVLDGSTLSALGFSYHSFGRSVVAGASASDQEPLDALYLDRSA